MLRLQILGLLWLFASVHARMITISNEVPRYDVFGNIVDSHDGGIIQMERNGLYYLYGTSYGDCVMEDHDLKPQGCIRDSPGHCGFKTTHNVSLYVSPNMASHSWRFIGHLLPIDHRPIGLYYRPKIIYNDMTNTFVLWINRFGVTSDGKELSGHSTLVVAKSKTLTGPFEVVQESAANRRADPGDLGIFVDNDGAAFIIYSVAAMLPGSHIIVQQLTPDYLGLTNTASANFTEDFCNESPAMFRRGKLYYVAFGHCCCFCQEGSGVRVHVAARPLGPYTFIGQIGRPGGNQSLPSSTSSQITQIFPLPLYNVNRKGAAPADFWLSSPWYYLGDAWYSAPDHVMDHDFSRLLPFLWDGATPRALQNVTSVTLET